MYSVNMSIPPPLYRNHSLANSEALEGGGLMSRVMLI